MPPGYWKFRLGGLLIAVSLLVACSGPVMPPSSPPMPAETQTAPGLSVTDAAGREVTFPEPPQRIVAAGRALFMVADALYFFPESSSRLVALGKTGQSQLDFIPVVDPAYQDKIILESETGPEQIAAARPDAVILKSINAETLGKPLEVLGIPVVYVDLETPDQYARDLNTLGQLLKNEARAAQVIDFYQQRRQRVAETLDDLQQDQKPRVLLLYYTDRDGAVAFNVPPLAWMQTLMTEMAGGQPMWTDAQLGQGWTRVSFEQIAAWDPDQVYIIAYFNDVDEVVRGLEADPQWQALRAVQEDRLYGFPADYYSWDQPTPRWILGLTWLASRIHPERFQDLDMAQEIRTFYREMYNLDEAAYQKYIQPKLTGDWR
ncbi:MAG: ABC transporter substrate-binding protein [Anaerolineae bacterium]